MNALLWVATGIVIGWFSNTLGMHEQPSARALTLVFATSGAVFGGWLLVPAGNALSLLGDAYSLAAHLAAALGAALWVVIMRALLRLSRPAARLRQQTVRSRAAAVRRASGLPPLGDTLADTGPDTVPSGRACGADDAPRSDATAPRVSGLSLRD